MIDDLTTCRYGEHASNLGALMAAELATSKSMPVYIADPVVVDEMIAEAKISGWPEFPRIAISIRLIKERWASATLVIRDIGMRISTSSLLTWVAALVGAHRKSRIIDVNNGLTVTDLFCRTNGSLPLRSVLDFVTVVNTAEKKLNVSLSARRIVRLSGY